MTMNAMTETDDIQDESPSLVTFGEVTFDPVAIQDFRLSVEGTSGAGKSNTLAVLLEDLADVALPTLVIERLGALTPVRLVDEQLTVVGAREEEGVDLAVALEDLDRVGSWVLDRGMKILVDISTYADYEEEKSRIHLAAARALRGLNDRAHEKYRSGDRTKSLLVVDEAHILAPKDSAPEPELDDWVKRCRGQLIKASTEGGNKGISTVVGYQRRAFLHNGVVQLARDFVAHRPGGEDIGRTADALRCSEEALAQLSTGEILVRGEAITDGELVGPTTVRKRESPDPREETFTLPETPDELADVLEEIQEEVEAERERRVRREDELEQLRDENDRLQERVDELEQELQDTDRLASALENLQGGNGEAVGDVGEGVADLRERVEELKQERDELLDDQSTALDEAAYWEEEAQQLEEQVADLEAEVQELRSAFDAASADVESLAETFDVDAELTTPTVEGDAGDVDEELQERIAEKDERIDELEQRVARLQQRSGDAIEPLSGYGEFLEDPDVRAVIDEAKEVHRTSPRYVKGLIAAILDKQGPVTYDTVADRLGIQDSSNVSKAASVLESYGLVEKENTADGMRVDLNVEGLNEVRRKAEARRRTDELMEDL
jgi:predicted  nucleic acid-binding Zn-ribbon protein